MAHRLHCHEVLYNNLQTWRAIRDYLGGLNGKRTPLEEALQGIFCQVASKFG